jgi:hypothetical protein
MSKEIKFSQARMTLYSSDKVWVGRKNGFKFHVRFSDYHSYYYVSVNHTSKDIRFNSMWQDINFKAFEEACKFCNEFKPENFDCLGKDFTKTKETA